jgi:hypothetical protein
MMEMEGEIGPGERRSDWRNFQNAKTFKVELLSEGQTKDR